jgi:NADH:ubiquinone oxidoreductase subunit E
MIDTKQNAMTEEIEMLVAKYGRTRDALMPIIQNIQINHGMVADFAQQEVARMLDVHPVEVYGVVTFYSFLSETLKGRYIVRLCRTISCDMAGKEAVARAIERELGIKFGETTRDNRFSLEYINCMGMCDQGPSMLVNDLVFTKLTPHTVVDILNRFK